MAWTPIDDTQVPNWVGILAPTVIGPFQFGAFQSIAYQVGTGASWSPVDDAQTPTWSALSPPPASVYTPVDDTQTPSWVPVP